MKNSVGSGQTLSNPVPKYQTLDLKVVNGLLKMMSRYVGDTPNSISPEVSTYLNISSISNYRNGFQQSDIKKSILWSITRSTPAFWGIIIQ